MEHNMQPITLAQSGSYIASSNIIKHQFPFLCAIHKLFTMCNSFDVVWQIFHIWKHHLANICKLHSRNTLVNFWQNVFSIV